MPRYIANSIGPAIGAGIDIYTGDYEQIPIDIATSVGPAGAAYGAAFSGLASPGILAVPSTMTMLNTMALPIRWTASGLREALNAPDGERTAAFKNKVLRDIDNETAYWTGVHDFVQPYAAQAAEHVGNASRKIGTAVDKVAKPLYDFLTQSKLPTKPVDPYTMEF